MGRQGRFLGCGGNQRVPERRDLLRDATQECGNLLR
jgi:hypothetical protein